MVSASFTSVVPCFILKVHSSKKLYIYVYIYIYIYINFQSIGLLKQKLLLWVSRLTLTYDHWANRSSGRYPDLLPKPHKNARIYTFCGVESRPGVCFRIRPYSKESQRKCSIQKESIITTYYRSQTTFEIKCSTPIGGAYKNFQSIGLLKQKLLLWVSRLTLPIGVEHFISKVVWLL